MGITDVTFHQYYVYLSKYALGFYVIWKRYASYNELKLTVRHCAQDRDTMNHACRQAYRNLMTQNLRLVSV
jgi:hypothetical protein